MSEIPADWAWTPITITCANGHENALHEQPPELMAKGVVWECSTCGVRGLLKSDEPTTETFGGLLECGNCHATYTDESPAFAALALQPDGEWHCPACSGANRAVAVGETASTTETGAGQ